MSMKYSLFYLTPVNENLSEINSLKMAEWINKCVDELTEWYFQKWFSFDLNRLNQGNYYIEVLIQLSLTQI